MYFPDKKLDFNDNFSFILPSISSSAQTAWHRPEIFAEHPCEIEGVPETETGRNLLDRVLLPPQEIPGQRHPVAQHITLRTLSEHRPEKPVQSRHAAAEPLCQRGAGEIHLRIPLNVFEDRIQASEQPALRKGSRLLPEHLQETETETRNFRLRPRLFRPEQLQAAVVQRAILPHSLRPEHKRGAKADPFPQQRHKRPLHFKRKALRLRWRRTEKPERRHLRNHNHLSRPGEKFPPSDLVSELPLRHALHQQTGKISPQQIPVSLPMRLI